MEEVKKPEITEEMIAKEQDKTNYLINIFEAWGASQYNITRKKGETTKTGYVTLPKYSNPNTNSALKAFLAGSYITADLMKKEFAEYMNSKVEYTVKGKEEDAPEENN